MASLARRDHVGIYNWAISTITGVAFGLTVDINLRSSSSHLAHASRSFFFNDNNSTLCLLCLIILHPSKVKSPSVFMFLLLLCVVAHKDRGADSATLLKISRLHIRSKLDFGCAVYGSARPSVLESLDRVQNATLRSCLGAFRTSPIPSLHVEAGELPLAYAANNLAYSISSNFAQTLQTLLFTASSTLVSVVCSKRDQALSQPLATGCKKASWIPESDR